MSKSKKKLISATIFFIWNLGWTASLATICVINHGSEFSNGALVGSVCAVMVIVTGNDLLKAVEVRK